METIARFATLSILPTLLWGCSGDRAAPPVEEQWVGFQEVRRSLLADGNEDGDTIWFSFIFEYASSGPFEDDAIEALLTVYENMEEGDTICNVPWLPEGDASCRIVVHGSGLRAANVARERIYIGGLDVPAYDNGCTFAGPVEDSIWHADLRCEDGDSIRLLASLDFAHEGLDGRLPEEATDSVSGTGDASETFKLDSEGTFNCTMTVEGEGSGIFGVTFHDAEDEEHGWVYEFLSDANDTWTEVVKVRNYPDPYDDEVAVGQGTLEVDAEADWSWHVWCRKVS